MEIMEIVTALRDYSTIWLVLIALMCARYEYKTFKNRKLVEDFARLSLENEIEIGLESERVGVI